MTHRAHLNRAAAQIAAQLGLAVQANSPWVARGDAPMPPGYFHMVWSLVDANQVTQARIVLECQGGYGAGAGRKSWFAGFVSVQEVVPGQYGLRTPGRDLGMKKLVHQWDYVCDGPSSARATRARFIEWAEAYRTPASLPWASIPA